MIDDRFARSEFEQCESNSSELDALISKLRLEIEAAMRSTLEVSFQAVADQLRSLGHELDSYEVEVDPDGGICLTYRELGLDRSHSDHKLRIHVDLISSSGYADRHHDADD